jgi:hypothetical protein
MLRDKLMFTALSVLLSAHSAGAAVVLNFFPASDYNANTATMDATLGTTGYTVDDFESTTLISGLTISLTGGVTSTTWTSLPALFDQGACPGLTTNQAWDGTHAVISTTTNAASNCNGPANISTFFTFNYAPGTTSFGLGLSNFQSTSPASPSFPITQHELFVNGVDMGVLETLAGAVWSPGLVRNAYLRVDGTNGTVTTSIGFENLTASDVLMIDHLAVAPSVTTPTPEPAAAGVVVPLLAVLAAFGSRRRVFR